MSLVNAQFDPAAKLPVIRVALPEPRIGSKIYLIEEKGVYVFEEGPSVLRSLACTHIGAGSFAIYDGVPDKDGFFPNHEMPVSHPEYQQSNGRRVFVMNPQIMGFWAIDGGCNHGLTCVAGGGMKNTPVFISVSWLAFKASVKTKPVLVAD